MKKILFIATLAVFFIFGAYWAEKEITPYFELKTILKNIIESNDKDKSISETFGNASLPVKKIDSVHLPLLMTEYNLDTIIKDKKYGGICSIDSIIIGVSWRGIFYSVDVQKNIVSAVEITPPNSQFSTAKSPSYYKVHDIDCNKNKNNNIDLIISYDKVFEGKKYLSLDMAVISNDLKIIKHWSNIFTSDPWYELDSDNGAGRIKILDSKKVLFSVSHIPSNPMIAQDNTVTNGKTVVIDLETKETSIFSSGHRNMQGIEQAKNGVIYTTEHGPKGGDELNLLREGRNYGWPLYTHGSEYETYGWRGNELVGRHQYDTHFAGPLMSWVPSIATSNLIEARDFHDRWNGDLLIGTLKNRSIYRTRIRNNTVVFLERIWIGERIRDIIRLKESFAILTDSAKILLISLDRKTLEMNIRENIDIREEFMVKCTNCHHFGETNSTSMAPSLGGLFDRNIASDSGYERYSPALTSMRNKVWSTDSLKDYLSDPSKFSPGTTMPKIDLNVYELDRIVNLLSKIK